MSNKLCMTFPHDYNYSFVCLHAFHASVQLHVMTWISSRGPACWFAVDGIRMPPLMSQPNLCNVGGVGFAGQQLYQVWLHDGFARYNKICLGLLLARTWLSGIYHTYWCIADTWLQPSRFLVFGPYHAKNECFPFLQQYISTKIALVESCKC